MKFKTWIILTTVCLFFLASGSFYTFATFGLNKPNTILSLDKTKEDIPYVKLKQPQAPDTAPQFLKKIAKFNFIKKNKQSKESLKLPILMYHHIKKVEGKDKTDAIQYGLSVSPEAFEKQMAALKAKNYNTITTEDLYNFYANKKELPDKPILLTFDDGWKDNLVNAVPVLKKYGFTGDFAIINNARGGEYLTWEELKTMKNDGMSFSSHTLNHCYLSPDKPDASPKARSPKNDKADQECPQFLFGGTLNTGQIRGELAKSKQELESKLGVKIYNLVYPFGRYNQDVAEIAKEVGYSFGMSTNPQTFDQSIDFEKPFDLGRTRVKV